MKYPFVFKYEVFIPEDNKSYQMTGLGVCKNYADAVRQIEAADGDDIMRITHIELFESDELLYLPEEVVEAYTEATYPAVDFAKEIE